MKISVGLELITKCRIEMTGLIHFMAPFTGGFKCEVPEGTKFVALTSPSSERGGFYVRPLEYEEFEINHVPKADRISKKYDGYSFVFNLAKIGTDYDVLFES